MNFSSYSAVAALLLMLVELVFIARVLLRPSRLLNNINAMSGPVL